MDKNQSLEPDPRDLDPAETRYRDADRNKGMGGIIAVVAIAALVIVGLLYTMQPQTETPARVTSEAPNATTPPPSK